MDTYVYSSPYYSQHLTESTQPLSLCAFYTNTDSCHIQQVYANLTLDFQNEFESLIRKFAMHSPGVFKISYAPPAFPVTYHTRMDGRPYDYHSVEQGGSLVFNQVSHPSPLDYARWFLWKHPLLDNMKVAFEKLTQKTRSLKPAF
ncbi:hypothetical protein GGI05_000309 [Coemansia sp. RSA 2603]|nr:hypothetical protein GGI05_000309 [Coemansia sp. RSA 2603]